MHYSPLAALDPTPSTSQLVTIKTFSPALCFSAHTNYNILSISSVTSHYIKPLLIPYFYSSSLLLFLYDVSTSTFCINVSYRLIVNGCVLSPMNDDTIQYNTERTYAHCVCCIVGLYSFQISANEAEECANLYLNHSDR